MEEIIHLHNKIKESPYWLGFDESFIKELRRDFYRLTNLISGKFTYFSINVYSDKYYAILESMTHDVNSYIGNLEYRYGKDTFKDAVTCLQNYLMVVHQMIDKWENPYICGQCKWRYTVKSESFEHPEYGTVWRRYCEIPIEDKPKILEWYRDYVKHMYNKESGLKAIERIEKECDTFYRFV